MSNQTQFHILPRETGTDAEGATFDWALMEGDRVFYTGETRTEVELRVADDIEFLEREIDRTRSREVAHYLRERVDRLEPLITHR